MEGLIGKLEEVLRLRSEMAAYESEFRENNQELELYELGESQDMIEGEIECLRKELIELGVNSSTHPHLFVNLTEG